MRLHSIEIAIADLPEERNQGLMDVNTLPENVGMLFIFDEEAPRSFWMVKHSTSARYHVLEVIV
ncbi:MAG: hypothetical protein BalsKO_15580 [Balneolaceae bacterium]